jgi:hypothetical protein
VGDRADGCAGHQRGIFDSQKEGIKQTVIGYPDARQ